MNQPTPLYEDNHLLVINKPSGWLSQGDATGDPSIIDWAKEYIARKYNKPGQVFVGLPHRLDRPVSGVLVLARTSKSLTRLNEMFRLDQVSKVYYALSDGKPQQQEGKLINFLIKDPAKNITKAVKKMKDGAKLSELNYEWVISGDEENLIKVMPKTGRPHQIRVQLAAMNCPIIGDVKYGGKNADSKGSIALHAHSITFIHPVKKEKVRYYSPLSNNQLMGAYNNQVK